MRRTTYIFAVGDPVILGSNTASLFQGAMMQRIAPEYAEYLHRSELKPYSQYVIGREGEVHWTIQTLDADATEKILCAPAMQNMEELFLEQKKRTLKLIETRSEILSEDELLRQTYFAQCERTARIRFLTPTAFKSGGEYVFYPTVHYIFQSLIGKYDASSEQTQVGTPELLQDIEQYTRIVGYNLHSTKFSLEGIRVPAFEGELMLRMNGPQQLVNLETMLLKFGTYSGVGIKTAIGMGALRLLERKERNAGRSV